MLNTQTERCGTMGGVSHALNIGPGKFGHDGDDDGHVDVDGDKHDDGGDDDQFI